MSTAAAAAPRSGSAADAIARLRTPDAIRERCGMVLAAAERGETAHFAIDPARLDPAAHYVLETIRARYPDLAIPYHSRWRHFAAGGRERWAALAAALAGTPAEEIARIRFDLAIVSVLLDAGAGERWRWVEPATGATFARSEGLAVASFDLFTSGVLSADPNQPLRADAAALMSLHRERLASAFQVRDDNPLTGLDGRAALLNRLGETVAADRRVFGDPPRVGHLFDRLAGLAERGRLPARDILITLLEALGPIWPGRTLLAGVSLGDVWRHPAARADDLTDGLVPLHKLSQWLAYSLLEPLKEAGIAVTDLDRLTALAEYRNGGLLIDLGVLVPRHPGVLGQPHDAGSEVVVEWRALTVAVIDRVAERIRAALGLSPAQLPLAKILEGGTWSAGRQIARERRPDGSPPLRVISDGTVF